MGSSSRAAIALCVVLGVAGVVSAQRAPKIAAGDQLKITVLNASDITMGPFTVDRGGAIEYPYLGLLKVAGLTPQELGSQIASGLVKAQVLVALPQVSVDLQQAQNKSVSVSGAVSQPAQYSFGGDEFTVYDALVKAGGAAATAGDVITFVHPSGEDEQLSRADVESGDPAKNPVVRDGDRIIVARA